MFDKLKQALGFGSNDTNEPSESKRELTSPAASPFERKKELTDNVGEDELENTVNAVFNHVVEQFNQALPDFLKKSVDAEKQRKYLYDTLHDDIKMHLTGLENRVREELHGKWQLERDKLQTDIKNISQTAKDIEAKSNELKSKQLSNDRQRRALNDRVRDLEKRIMTLEAEKEQLEIENKSMINKIKVAQVYEKDIEDLRAHIEHLNSQNQNSDGTTPKSSSKSELETEVIKQNKQLSDKVNALNADNKKLKERIESLSQIETEYNEMSGKMEEVEQLLSKIDEVTAAKDAKIANYREQLKSAKNAVDTRNEEIKTLTSENERLKNEISELRSTKSTESKKESAPLKSNGRIMSDEDDDLLTDTDWIVQPGKKAEKTSSQTNVKAKSKKHNKRDDGQMSLW